MLNQRWRTRFAPLFILFLIAACSGLSGEPEIVATISVDTSSSQATQANITNGAALFAEHCTDCHGISGDSQGELVLTGEVPEMPSFLVPETSRVQSPQQWFDTITNGRIQNLMPPWSRELSAQQRWDVALYTYTLHYSPEAIQQGEVVWQTIQSSLEDADTQAFSDFAAMVTISDQQLHDDLLQVTNNTISSEEAWAAVAYLRTLTLTNPDDIGMVAAVPPPATTEDASEPAVESTVEVNEQGEPIATFKGTIHNGTEGFDLPPAMTVSLRYGNPDTGLETIDTTIDENGNFRFEGVPISDEMGYIAFAIYNDFTFSSDVIIGSLTTSEIDLSFDVYEVTSDPSVVRIKAMELFIDGLTVDSMGSGLYVSQLVTYENTSDRMFTTNRDVGDGRYASLLFEMPPGSLIQNDPNNSRFIIADDLFALIDTQAVFPGKEHFIQAVYFVPYAEGAIMEQRLNNAAVDADVRLLIHPQNLLVDQSGLLQQTGEEVHLERTYTLYEGTLNSEAGDPFRYDVSGVLQNTSTATNNPVVVTSDNLPLLIGGLIVILIAASVAFAFYRTSQKNDPQKEIDMLLRQIAELDSMHEAGQINHDVYQRQRQDLKAQLTKLMQDTDQGRNKQ